MFAIVNARLVLEDGVLENGIVYSPVQSIALILFIVTVGLLASKDLIAVVKRYGARFIFMGTLTPTFGAVLAMLICHLLPGCTAFEAVGVLTGSQTSSPGLAIGLETGERVALAAATAAGMDAEAYAAAMMARALVMLGVLNDPIAHLRASAILSISLSDTSIFILLSAACGGTSNCL